MTFPGKVVFLFDVDNTLLNKEKEHHSLLQTFGS